MNKMSHHFPNFMEKPAPQRESDNKLKAEILNNQFKSVFTKENTNFPKEPYSNMSYAWQYHHNKARLALPIANCAIGKTVCYMAKIK